MAETPTFNSRDPLQAGFWDERFNAGFTPWDQQGAPQLLQEFLAQQPARRLLIPGCGHAHELALFVRAGWQVTAIDFSSAAVAAAQGQLADPVLAACVQQADFFQWQATQPLQAIYERAFLCALPPARRADVVARWATLLPPGGLLFGSFFVDPAAADVQALRGPPFPIHPAQLQDLLQPHFSCLQDQASPDALAVFDGRERWQVWQRRPLSD